MPVFFPALAGPAAVHVEFTHTHFGGEEDYDLYFVPGEKAFKTTQAGLKAMNRHGVNQYRLEAHVGYIEGLPGF